MAESIFDRMARKAREGNENPDAQRKREAAKKEAEEEARRKRQRGRDADYHRENKGQENDPGVIQTMRRLFGKQ